VQQRDLETAVLRQLKILGRGGTRSRFTTADRAFLAAAAGLLSRDRWRSFPGGPGHDHPMAPSARRRAPRPLAPARPSPARSLDQRPDPSPGEGERALGLPQAQGGASLSSGSRSRPRQSPPCSAAAAWARAPVGSGRPGHSSCGFRRTVCSPAAPGPTRRTPGRTSPLARTRKHRSRSATTQPPPTMNPAMTTHHVPGDSPIATVGRVGPWLRFHRASDLGLATGPRWLPESWGSQGLHSHRS